MACQHCGKVKQEQLACVADNPLYTKRFALYVGRRCRASTIRDVATDLRLDWHTVKTLEQQYMREQLRRAGTPGPRVIGLDEISLRRGHTYRIVVTDLIRARAIWFGGTDRSEASLDAFFIWLGSRKSRLIRVAVMDMWKAFRASTRHHAPQASILFGKFHVLRHLSAASRLLAASKVFRARRPSQGEVRTMREERVLLALDEATILSRETRVLALADEVEGDAEVSQDMELVEENTRLRRMVAGRGAEGLPHIHHRHPDLPAFPRP